MFRLAQYSKQFNQKAELWRRMKCGATVVILRYSIICCWEIDPSKFAFSRWDGSSFFSSRAEEDLKRECNFLADIMTEDLDKENGSLADCYNWGFDLWPASEDEGGPSSEYKRSASFPNLLLESEDEGGPSSEYKGALPFPKLAQQLRREKKNQTERHLCIYCVAAQTLKDSDEFASSFAFSISS